jgi:hypothetical protein
VDLNNSGALDLVVNRINAPAAIYRNHARTLNGNGYLTVELRGSRGNTSGIGARVTIKEHGTMQVLEQNLTRGFESSVDPRLHFGVGQAKQIDSLIVVWPDRRTQVMTNVSVNRMVTFWQDSAGRRETGDGRRETENPREAHLSTASVSQQPARAASSKPLFPRLPPPVSCLPRRTARWL